MLELQEGRVTATTTARHRERFSAMGGAPQIRINHHAVNVKKTGRCTRQHPTHDCVFHGEFRKSGEALNCLSEFVVAPLANVSESKTSKLAILVKSDATYVSDPSESNSQSTKVSEGYYKETYTL